MNVLLEPIILYLVLFPGVFLGPPAAVAPVAISSVPAVAVTLLRTASLLALVFYVMSKSRPLSSWGLARPGKPDAAAFPVAFAAIAIVGTAVAAGAGKFGGQAAAVLILPPESVASWIMLAVCVLAGAYLEEGFFRFYLLSKWTKTGAGSVDIGRHSAGAGSSIMFALCHAYSGPWGFLNAALSGVALSYVFLWSKSLHGISLAHGLYNVLAITLARA